MKINDVSNFSQSKSILQIRSLQGKLVESGW